MIIADSYEIPDTISIDADAIKRGAWIVVLEELWSSLKKTEKSEPPYGQADVGSVLQWTQQLWLKWNPECQDASEDKWDKCAYSLSNPDYVWLDNYNEKLSAFGSQADADAAARVFMFALTRFGDKGPFLYSNDCDSFYRRLVRLGTAKLSCDKYGQIHSGRVKTIYKF